MKKNICNIKKTKTFFLYLILFFFALINFNIQCSATEQQKIYEDIINEQYDENNLKELEENLPNETKKDLDELGLNLKDTQSIQNFNIFKIFSYIFSKTLKIIKTPIIIFTNCLVIIILCALFNSFKTTNFSNNLDNVIGILISLCSFGIIISPIISCITNISKTINSFGNFMLCFIPVFAGIIAISKGVASSVAYNSALFIISQIISLITKDLLLPVTGSFLALSISGSFNESFNISGLTSAIKKVVIFTLSLLVTIFVGIFTIQSSLASNADTVGIKTAKFLSGSFIPIIGSSLGDAISSIFSGLNIIKTAVGGFGIIVCLITLLPPILTVGFFILFAAFAQEISNAFKINTIPNVLAAIKDCLTIFFAFLICYAVLIVSTTSIIINMGAK